MKKLVKQPTPQDLKKMEIAEELGLMDKVRRGGWGSLTAAETGRIGGLISGRGKGDKPDDAHRPGG